VTLILIPKIDINNFISNKKFNVIYSAANRTLLAGIKDDDIDIIILFEKEKFLYNKIFIFLIYKL